jgi:hypothetical protein
MWRQEEDLTSSTVQNNRMIFKKHLALLLIIIPFTCCNDKVIENKRTGIKALPGWDIYIAGVYRYGPSIIINDDNTIDAWFAAPGDKYDEYGKKNYSVGNDIHSH